jgi:tripartite-type tricarboxylate transporter receptor subunit TctC
MQMRKRNRAARFTVRATLRAAALAAGLIGPAGGALGDQPFPSKPITLIVPGLPGGAFDPPARALAEHVSRMLGQPVIVDHKPGGTMTLGPTTMAHNARPDGHTLSMVVSTIVRIPLMQKVAFDPFADFTYILQVCAVTVGIVTGSEQPFQSLSDAIEYARANPGKLTYGTPGVGSGAHFGMEHVAQVAGISMRHVPFRGAQEGLPAVLGGHVMLYVSASEWKPQVEAGQLRLLAVYTEERRTSWPHTPTLKELGYASPVAAATFGIAGPKGMDPAVTGKLHDAFKAALESPAVRQTLAKHELVPSYAGPDAYRRGLEEVARADKVMVERLGLRRKE